MVSDYIAKQKKQDQTPKNDHKSQEKPTTPVARPVTGYDIPNLVGYPQSLYMLGASSSSHGCVKPKQVTHERATRTAQAAQSTKETPMAYEKGGNCWNCGAELTPLDYGRADTCPKCRRDTKACKGCEFYDPNYNNQCRESQADRVVEKERSNFCDYFKPRSGIGSKNSAASAAKAAAEALFKKK